MTGKALAVKSKGASTIPALNSEDGLNRYLAEIKKFPILTAEEEYMLAKRFEEHQDPEAAAKLVTSHLRLVAKIAMGYRGYGLPQAEVISEANVGLMQAVKRFDPERGFRLATYAMWWIRASIQEYILRSWSLVKLGTTSGQKKLFFNLRSAKKSLSWLSPDEAQAIADDLGVDIREVQRMEGRLSSRDLGYDQPLDADDDDTWQAPQYYLEDHSADPALMAESSDWQDNSESQLHEALAGLDERSRDILAQRWLTEDKSTLHDLAAQYGVSAERIRQLEQNAMKKLRAAIAA